MKKSKGCGSCKKKTTGKVKLLRSALSNGVSFEEAVIYAGFNESDLSKAYRIALTDLPLRKQADFVSLINWN